MKIRGFEVAKGFEESGVVIPHRNTTRSAGYDLQLIEALALEPGARKLGKTGLKAYMQDDEVLELYARSSVAYKQGVFLANSVGVIDADYYENEANDGHIMVALYNSSDVAVSFEVGERVAQAIFKKYLVCDDEFVTENERSGGFGSTGK